jgi:hypothetical protein
VKLTDIECVWDTSGEDDGTVRECVNDFRDTLGDMDRVADAVTLLGLCVSSCVGVPDTVASDVSVPLVDGVPIEPDGEAVTLSGPSEMVSEWLRCCVSERELLGPLGELVGERVTNDFVSSRVGVDDVDMTGEALGVGLRVTSVLEMERVKDGVADMVGLGLDADSDCPDESDDEGDRVRVPAPAARTV